MNIRFEYGRDALRYVIKTNEIKSIHIPYYLCDVIRHSIVAEGCKPLFYHIDDNFMPVCEFTTEAFILYPNYFGICENNVIELANKYPKLIVDNAHSYYSIPRGFATFYCGHKFGYTDSVLYIKGKQITAKNKIFDRKKFLERHEKFLELHKKYKEINKLKIQLSKDLAPFVYPCLTENESIADKLADKLITEGKNIYRYWNNLPKSYNEYKFYSRLVPIPLD